MRVYDYLISKLRSEGALHFTLIDPDPIKVTPEEASEVAEFAERCGTSAIMVGGSIGVSEEYLDQVVRSIKSRVKIPVILFPGNISGISKYADAIWFMSLLNSASTYYLIEAQVLGAVLIKRYSLEAIPLGYIIVEPGEAAGYIGHARPIPIKHPELAAAYGLAAQYLGMKFIYLERGSGADSPLPPEFVAQVAAVVDIPIIVGGGVRTRAAACALIEAGASAIVTGTVVEEEGGSKLREIIMGVREGALKRRGKAWRGCRSTLEH